MASGLQCPGCGHVHPAGLPEIVRGDTTFRCYGCYRTLSVPEGWTGRSSPRPPAPAPGPAGDGPFGAGTRDARAARLAARRAPRGGSRGGDEATQMVPTAGPDGEAGSPNWPSAGATGASPAPDWPAAGSSGASPGADWRAAGASGTRGTGAGAAAGSPLGGVAPRRTGRSVPAAVRAAVWAVAFGVGLLVTAFVLRAAGLLGVNTAIDVYAGSGAHRFGILLILLPLWALLSATIAHFSLEGLARRRMRSAKQA